MTAATMTPAPHRRPSRPAPAAGETRLGLPRRDGPVALLWVLPLVFVILVAVRSFDDIAPNGLGTWPQSFTSAPSRPPGSTVTSASPCETA